MLPNERLAFKTEKISWYLARDQKALRAGQLLPREQDAGKKSAWAFSQEQGHDPAAPSLEMQALGMLLQAQRTTPRSTIEGICVPRTELLAAWVAEDDAPHPIRGLERTHRSLATGEEGVGARMLGVCSFQKWFYTRDMLIETLRSLTERDLIADEYKPEAAAVLATASS